MYNYFFYLLLCSLFLFHSIYCNYENSDKILPISLSFHNENDFSTLIILQQLSLLLFMFHYLIIRSFYKHTLNVFYVILYFFYVIEYQINEWICCDLFFVLNTIMSDGLWLNWLRLYYDFFFHGRAYIGKSYTSEFFFLPPQTHKMLFAIFYSQKRILFTYFFLLRTGRTICACIFFFSCDDK